MIKCKSIFDSETIQLMHNKAENVISIPKHEILLSYRFQCLSPFTENFNDRFFVILTKDKLYLSKDLPSVISLTKRIRIDCCINLRWTYLTFYEMNKQINHPAYHLKFTDGHQLVWLVTYDPEIYYSWIESLTPLTLQTDFKTKYMVKKLLRNEHFYNLYVLIDRRSGNEVLSKRFEKNNLKEKETHQFLSKQVEILTKLIHMKGVDKLIEIQECKNSVHVIMEYPNGNNLIELQKILSPSKILDILLYSLTILKDIHDKRITHQNLTAENIVISHYNPMLTASDIRIINFDRAIIHTNKILKRNIIKYKHHNKESKFHREAHNNYHWKDMYDLGNLIQKLLKGDDLEASNNDMNLEKHSRITLDRYLFPKNVLELPRPRKFISS